MHSDSGLHIEIQYEMHGLLLVLCDPYTRYYILASMLSKMWVTINMNDRVEAFAGENQSVEQT